MASEITTFFPGAGSPALPLREAPIAPLGAVCILCKEEHGFGDIVFAKKLFDTIRACSFARNLSILFSATNEQTARKVHLLYPDLTLKESSELFSDSPKVPTLLIEGPLFNQSTGKSVKEAATPLYTLLRIGEYSRTGMAGLGPDETYERSGPGDDELGIFVDEGLYHFGCKLFEAGKTSSPETVERLENTQLKSLIETHPGRLYFGYANGIIAGIQFIKDIFTIENGEETNISVCLPQPEYFDLDFSYYIEHILELAKEHHCSVEIWTPGSIENPSLSLLAGHEDPESKKKISLFIPLRVSHNDFISLLAASEPFTLITGDQSLSEALSIGKSISLQTLRHKKALLSNLISLSSKLGLTKVQALLERKSICDAMPDLKEELPEGFLKDGQLRREMRIFSDFLYKERNLQKNVIKRVESWLASLS